MADMSFTAKAHALVPMRGGKAIAILAWLLPAIALLFIVLIVPFPGSPNRFDPLCAVQILWLVSYVAMGLRLIPQQEVWVLERFRHYAGIRRGLTWLCLPGLVDRIKMRDNFRAHEYPLYEDDASAVIDFVDASAPIQAQAWYSIANPADVADLDSPDKQKRREAFLRVQDQVALWAYSVENPRKRAAAIVDAALRPRLQSLTIDEASRNHDDVLAAAADEARIGLEHIGAYMRPEKAIVLGDIDLPPEVVALRNLKLEGEKEAEEFEAKYRGAAHGVLAIIAEFEKKGHTIDIDEARAILREQRGFDALEGAPKTFIGSDINQMTRSVVAGEAAAQGIRDNVDTSRDRRGSSDSSRRPGPTKPSDKK